MLVFEHASCVCKQSINLSPPKHQMLSIVLTKIVSIRWTAMALDTMVSNFGDTIVDMWDVLLWGGCAVKLRICGSGGDCVWDQQPNSSHVSCKAQARLSYSGAIPQLA